MPARSRNRRRHSNDLSNTYHRLFGQGFQIGLGSNLPAPHADNELVFAENKKIEKEVSKITRAEWWRSEISKFAAEKQSQYGSFEALIRICQQSGAPIDSTHIIQLVKSISAEVYRQIIDGEDRYLQELARKQDIEGFKKEKGALLKRISKHMNGAYGIGSHHPTLDRNLLQRIWHRRVKEGKLFREIDKIENLPDNESDLVFSGDRSKGHFFKFQKRELKKFMEFSFFCEELVVRFTLRANLNNFFKDKFRIFDLGTKHAYFQAMTSTRLMQECHARLKKHYRELVSK